MTADYKNLPASVLGKIAELEHQCISLSTKLDRCRRDLQGLRVQQRDLTSRTVDDEYEANRENPMAQGFHSSTPASPPEPSGSRWEASSRSGGSMALCCINDRFDALALDAPVFDQCRRQCRDGAPVRRQQRQCAFSERLRVVADTCQPEEITEHGCGALQVSFNGAVGLRERQYRTPASLAAMASLGNAASELNDDLRLHQVAEWFGDGFDGPSHRIDIRPEAVAAQASRSVIDDLDKLDRQQRRRVRQPLGSAECHRDGDGVASLVIGG